MVRKRKPVVAFFVLVFLLLGLAYRWRDTPFPSGIPASSFGSLWSSVMPEPSLPASSGPAGVRTDASVVRVVDGDTVDVSENGKMLRVRLIGVDTPEIVDPRKPVQCFAREASDETKALLTGKSVILETDPTQGDLDMYGRSLRYVYLPDGAMVNRVLISEGYAHEYTYRTPYVYQADFRKAERAARERKVGLWADGMCDGYRTK